MALLTEAAASGLDLPTEEFKARVDPVVYAVLEGWVLPNEDLTRQAVELGMRALGTAGDQARTDRRRWKVRDWIVRVQAPTWLRAAGLHADATALSAPVLGEITGRPSLEMARELLSAAQDRADAARDAAWDAVRYAVRNAAWDTVRDAVGYAARTAVRDAARYAVGYAARTAVRDAARDAAWDAIENAARYAAWDAAWTVALTPLVGLPPCQVERQVRLGRIRFALQPVVDELAFTVITLLRELIEMR